MEKTAWRGPAWRTTAETIEREKTGQFDELAKDRSEQKDGEIKLQKADHLFHEQAGKHRRDEHGIGEQHRAQSDEWSEQDDAMAAISCQHQERQRREDDQEAHEAVHPPSIVIVWPVIFRASGLIRYSIAPATSSKVMKAFFGIGASITFSIT